MNRCSMDSPVLVVEERDSDFFRCKQSDRLLSTTDKQDLRTLDMLTQKLSLSVLVGPSGHTVNESEYPQRTLTPCTAYNQGRYYIMTPTSMNALKIFKLTGFLPPKMPSQVAFHLLAYAKQYSLVPLQTAAFQALANSFRNKNDTLQDYCQAIWLVSRNLKIPFLSEEKQIALQEVRRSSEDLRLELSEFEEKELLQVLVERSMNSLDNGLGPIRFSDLAIVLANYKYIGHTFRILTNGADGVILRAVKTKDVHELALYAKHICKGKLCPPCVRNQAQYSVNISKIEVAEKLLANNPRVRAAEEFLKQKNPNIQFTGEIEDFSERAHNKAEKPFCILPLC